MNKMASGIKALLNQSFGNMLLAWKTKSEVTFETEQLKWLFDRILSV
jgi:hypothetical protein